MTGQGGWPLNAFLTPEQAPFFVGTYYPPEPRHGMPTWRAVLEGVATAWNDRRDAIREQGSEVLKVLGGASRLPSSEQPLTPGRAHARRWPSCAKSMTSPTTASGARRSSRRRRRSSSCWPPASARCRWACCGRWRPAASMTRSAAASRAMPSTPPGRCRTSRRCSTTTRCWRAPICTAGRSPARSGCAGSAARPWTGRCGRCAGPRAASARRWTPTPRASRASSTSGRWTSCWRRWGARAWPGRHWPTSVPTAEGNFEGSNVLEGRGPEPARLTEIQARLLQVRAERVRPGTDDKRLCSWNALMISALAEAGAALDRADYLRAAVDCAEFLLGAMRDISDPAHPRLLRTWKDGRGHIDAYLEDHAYLLEALLTLYEATFDPRWYGEAVALADVMIARFADGEGGGFFTTAADQDTGFARRKDLDDSPIPAAGSSAAFGLLRLALISGDASYERHALGRPGRAGADRRPPSPRLRPRAAGDRLPPGAGCGRWRSSATGRLRRARRRGARRATARTWCWPATGRRCRRRGAAAARPRARRRPARRLRVRGVRLPGAGHDRRGAGSVVLSR